MDNPADFDDLTERYGDMSRVITFRLNPKDSIEAKALAYLARLERSGMKPREIIARALAQAGERDDQLSRIEQMQQRTIRLLDELSTSGLKAGLSPEQQRNANELSDGLKRNLIMNKRAAKSIDDIEGQGE